MTGFDIIVLAIVGVAAIGGFLRGFMQEALSLAAWVLALFAIHYFHTDLAAMLHRLVSAPSGAGVLAFVVLFLVPYGAMKLIAYKAGKASRNSVLGPIDRVIGFGFGMVKGLIISVMAFSLLVLAYDLVWGREGRPDWIVDARSYAFVNASSEDLVLLIKERRQTLFEDEAAE